MKKYFIVMFAILFLFSCNKQNVPNGGEQVGGDVNQGQDIVTDNQDNNNPDDVNNTNDSDELDKASEELIRVGNLIDDGKYSEAEQALLKIENDDNSEIYRMYGKIYLGQKNYDKALENYLSANKIEDGKNHDTLMLIGVTYDNLGNKEKAKEFLNKSLGIKSDYKNAKDYLAQMNENENTLGGNNITTQIDQLIEKKQFAEAETKLKQLDQNSQDTISIYGRLKFNEAKYEEALTYYDKLDKLQGSNDYNTKYMIGVIYDNLGNKEKAEQYVNKSLELKPDFDLAKQYLELFKMEDNVVTE